MEKSNMFAKAFCMLLLVVCPACGDFRKSPVNTVAVDGDTVHLECQPDTGSVDLFDWTHVTLPPETLTRGKIEVSDRVDLTYDEDTLVYDLDLNTTADGQIQQYSCKNLVMNYFVDLILLDTTPSCDVSANLTDLIEGETFTVECTANYNSRSNWNAEMKCFFNGQDQKTEDAGSTDGRMKRSFTVESDATLHHDHSYVCEVNFPAPPKGVIAEDTDKLKYNKDQPKYKFTYTTDKLNVQFGVQKISIGNEKEEYYPGDEVTCTAEGRPAVSYIWVEVKADGDDNLTPTEVLTITESMVGKNNRYRCEASNTIRDQVYTINQTIEFTVSIPTTAPPMTTVPLTTVGTVPPPSGLSGGAIAGIVIGVVLGLLLIFLLLLFLIIRSRRPAKKKPESKPASSQQYGGTLQPTYSVPTKKVDNDDLGMFVRDNTVGSRKPLPAEEPGAQVNKSFGPEYI